LTQPVRHGSAVAILTAPKTWRKPTALAKRSPDLTADELGNVRRALRFLRAKLGGASQLAAAMGVTEHAAHRAFEAKRRPSVALALRVSRVAGVSLESILHGEWPPEGACPHCGRS
jgi:DNA-binding phage protein